MSRISLDITHIRSDLIAKIRAAAHSRSYVLNATHSRTAPGSVTLRRRVAPSVTPAVVAIGVSTGGPKALEQILPRFPRDFPVPILIVQHMPVGFTRPFAQRLNALSAITVHEAGQCELIQPGIA